MARIARVFDDIQDAERDLADALRTLVEQHASEVDVYHVADLLASRCAHQVELLAPHAERHGAHMRIDGDAEDPFTGPDRSFSPDPAAYDIAPGLRLLSDLQRLYLIAHRAELAWVVLFQVAQAARDESLVSVAREGLEEAERRWKWLRTKIKESCPQVLAI